MLLIEGTKFRKLETASQTWVIAESLFTSDISNILSKCFLETDLGEVVEGGRLGVRILELPLASGGNISSVVRGYGRGGLIAKLGIRDKYLYPKAGLFSTRPFLELQTLAILQKTVGRVPEVLAAGVMKEGKFYKGILVTKKIPGAVTLQEIGSDKSSYGFALEAGKLAAKILSAGVLHLDLHPGNVLLSSKNEVFIIDFDKAKTGLNEAQKQKGKDYLIERWARACRKQYLPVRVVSKFRDGLEAS